MTPEYDALTRAYQRSKTLPFRIYSEIPDHLNLLGDVRGLSVLDVACGEGFYTRRIRERGAARVVGVDVSPEMIALARQQEIESPVGVEYFVAAAEALPGTESIEPASFDVVSAAYLLNCAPDRAALQAMTDAIAHCLIPGGRFVATLGDLGHAPHVDYTAYGMATDITPDVAWTSRPCAPSTGGVLPEGAPYTITFLLEEDTFTITDFNHSRETYAAACEQSGLHVLGWHPCTVTDEGLRKLGREYWSTWLESPCIWRLEARKRNEVDVS